MRVGTKSVLWGVHCVWWHFWTVALAWRKIYGAWPCWWEWVAIFFHDFPGYWGCSEMDGPEGVLHPQRSARVAAWVAGLFSTEAAFKTYFLVLYHSSTFAKLHGAKTSRLYLPDKVSILMETKWWYIFRARLSGEIKEYVKNSPHDNELDWYLYYSASVKRKLNAHDYARRKTNPS